MGNPACENVKKEAKEESEYLSGLISPKGTLGLPELLDRRRLQHGIPDRAFEAQAMFDRIYVWQIWVHQEETFVPGGAIVQPANYRESDLRENPQGIILSAGLGALDHLRSNGADLGHHVNILHVQPWRIPVGIKDSEGVLVLQTGDVSGSLDLRKALRRGKCRITVRMNEHGQRVHLYEDEQGQVWDPTSPWIADDM